MNGQPVKEHPPSLVPIMRSGSSGMEAREVEYRPTEARSCRGSSGLRIHPTALEGALKCLS